MKRKRLIIITTFTVAVAALTACGKNPDSSIVKNKDFNKMIEKAKDPEGETKEIKDIAPEYDTYKSSLIDESLKVSVKADAKVDIPNADKLSIVRMRQKKISQDFIDKVIGRLMGDEKLYDGSVTQVRTRKEIEEEIRSTKQLMNEDDGEDYQLTLDRLQEEYENSPAEINWDNFGTDKMIHGVKEMSEKMNNSFYTWQEELNPDGEVFYAVNNGENGEFMSLYAQNSEDYGNCLRFGKSRHGYIWNMSVSVDLADIPSDEETNKDGGYTIWKAGNGNNGLSEYEDEGVTMPENEAIKMADEFMEDIGITDFSFHDSGLYSESQRLEGQNADEGYCTYYLIRYVRQLDGTCVTLTGENKFKEGWDKETYVKKMWPEECIEFKINDNGIIEFIYSGPMEITETVVDKSNLKPFNEIKDTFEKMVIAANAQYELEDVSTNINVDRVVLGYALVSEKDRFDTGLLVPVWDFIGTEELVMEKGRELRKEYKSIMTINAIDGTVIDRTLGY